MSSVNSNQMTRMDDLITGNHKVSIAKRARVRLAEVFSKLDRSWQFWERASIQRFFELSGKIGDFPKSSKFERKLWRKLLAREISRLLDPVPKRATPCSPKPCMIRKFEKDGWLQPPKTRWGKIENLIFLNIFDEKIARKQNFRFTR